jgi:broad specificity phosphatase PhoE
MIITFVRHGEVDTKYIGKYNGHIDIPLSANGKLQAKQLAKKLINECFDKIYCSDLLRARQTLEPFEHSLEIVYTQRLREKSWGIHEGKSFQEIEKSGIYYKNFTQWITALDGEDLELYTNRIEDYFYNIILKSNHKNILLVTHSGFIKTFLSIMQKISLEVAFNTNLKYAYIIKFDMNTKKIL